MKNFVKKKMRNFSFETIVNIKEETENVIAVLSKNKVTLNIQLKAKADVLQNEKAGR